MACIPFFISYQLSLLLVVPDSVSETFNVKTLHTVFIVFLPVVLWIHLHLLLLGLHKGGLVIVHFVVHVVVVARALDRVLFVELIQQLHENLVMVVETLRLDFLAPVLIVHLHIVENSIHQHANVRILVAK